MLSDDPTVKMFAIGMASAVLIDATIVRMILVPAVMTLLGDHAWYLPPWLDRVIPDLELEGSLDDDDDAAEEPEHAGGPGVPAQRTQPHEEQSSPVAGRTGPPPSSS